MERLMELVDVEAGEVCCISNFEAKVNQVNLYMIKFYLWLNYMFRYGFVCIDIHNWPNNREVNFTVQIN